MTFRKRCEALRMILTGSICVRPGSVYDAVSIRIAEDLGFELGMFGFQAVEHELEFFTGFVELGGE